jgi:hypothetical protein
MLFPMDPDAVLALLVVLGWMTVARAVLVYVNVLPKTCYHCGRRLERRYLGEPVCSCD